MPSSSLSAYLAKNYLSASTPTSSRISDPSDIRPSKKRKKNKPSHDESINGSLLIADDDDDLLLSSKSRSRNQDEDDEDRPMYFDTKVRSAEFRKSKKNAWQSLSTGGDGNSSTKVDQAGKYEDDDAGVLLRQMIAAKEAARSNLEAENAPAIVDNDGTPRMESGVRAGIQTAADTARLVADQEMRKEREAEEQRRQARKKKSKKPGIKEEGQQEEEETIYRDATGRRIDLTLRRQEAQRLEREKAQAEKKAREDAMGEVQLKAREQRKQDLEDAKFLTVGRSVNDEDMNRTMKEEVRWNDPMAAYMARKRADEEDEDEAASNQKGSHSGTLARGGRIQSVKKQEYQGAAPPNRYGIKPGWRWDGVDRGNGFENQWFQARGRKSRNENLEYQWQMDE